MLSNPGLGLSYRFSRPGTKEADLVHVDEEAHRRIIANVRVLHAISGIDPRLGGPAVALAGMSVAQKRQGMEVTIAYSWVDMPAEQAAATLRDEGVAVSAIGPCRDPMSRHSGMVQFLRPMIEAADVVHIHGIWEQVQWKAAHLARKANVPYVFTPHGMLDPWNMSRRPLRKRLYLMAGMRRRLNGAAAIHVMTEIERGYVARLRLRPRLVVEPLGLDWRECESLPEEGAFRAAYPALERRPLVLFLGRIDQGKGLELLVPAFAQLLRSRSQQTKPAPMLVIAGPDHGYRPHVEAEIQQLGLKQHVLFCGMLNNQKRIAALRDAYLLCLPSWHENFGLAAAEALACGTPVIVSDQVNIHPQIRQAGMGAVVRLDVDELAHELGRWLEDDDLRRRAGAAGRDYARQNWDWQTLAGHWRQWYGGISPAGNAQRLGE
jgi:glycosyltransferase involved in cell wall biosynthesis